MSETASCEISCFGHKATVVLGDKPVDLLKNLVVAYEREVNPSSDWTETALTKEEWMEATKAWREAKEFLQGGAK